MSGTIFTVLELPLPAAINIILFSILTLFFSAIMMCIGERIIRALAKFYRSVCFGLAMDHLRRGMKEDEGEEIFRIAKLQKDLITEVNKKEDK